MTRSVQGMARYAALAGAAFWCVACGIGGSDSIDLLAQRRNGGAGGSSGGSDASGVPNSGGLSSSPEAGMGQCGECPASQPFCDSTQGQCVECLSPDDCGAANRTCNAATRSCIDGCSADSACPASVPHCDVATGRCLVCTSDTHCVIGDDIRCDLTLGRCVDCIEDADCPYAARPYCEPLYRECVHCVGDADCPAGQHCTGALGGWQCVT